ncbi:ComEA family DNA-binding protein [Micromonospora coxensis]|uniref:Helix-hairpin-helix motif-containing protein n=1 Tax=Micromonospora coxensis TaxID=356852 RepID=A0A1C5JCZ0_9ACTN|nr:helix-hairpin-helix domain-containing protein [Micromonospora coxensis]SCG68151.1 Helix-hairpin-helix motif-containing protein [Micromonospora coxensis]
MSTGPDGSWQPFPPGPPPGAYGPGGPATLGPPPTPSSANPAASWKWRLLHSWWLLLPIIGCGCLGGFGFLYVGLRARRPAWWIAGIGYAVLGWTALFLADGDKDSVRGDISASLALATWAACVVHGILINPAWLRWQAGYRPWYRQPQGGPGGQPPVPPPVASFTPWPPPPGSVGPGFPPVSVPPSPAASWPAPAAPTPLGVPAPTTPPGVPAPTMPLGVPAPTMPLGVPAPTTPPGVSAPTTSAPAMPAGAPATPVAPVSGAPASGPPAGSTVDVNTATAAQLGALPGFDAARVHRVLAERDARRAFGSVAEFVAAAGLAPHEYAPLRHVLVCAPPPSPPPGTGHGRVLDF